MSHVNMLVVIFDITVRRWYFSCLSWHSCCLYSCFISASEATALRRYKIWLLLLLLFIPAKWLVRKTVFCTSQVIDWEDHLWNDL